MYLVLPAESLALVSEVLARFADRQPRARKISLCDLSVVGCWNFLFFLLFRRSPGGPSGLEVLIPYKLNSSSVDIQFLPSSRGRGNKQNGYEDDFDLIRRPGPKDIPIVGQGKVSFSTK